MTFLDRWLQKQRIQQAKRFIPDQPILLDIGCHNGELFTALGNRLQKGFGMDPLLPKDIQHERYKLTKGIFPADWTTNEKPNCITMLAVLEHIPTADQVIVAQKCFSILSENGMVILTVPSQQTDRILLVLKKLRLIKGMSLEEHYGFDPAATTVLFESAGFSLLQRKSF